MALFKSNDPAKLIATAEANLNRLKTELAETGIMAERHKATATRLAAEGTDIDGRKRAQEAMKLAADCAEISTAAIEDVERKLAKLIADRDAAADKAARHATANEIEAKLRESGDISRECQAFFQRLADFADWAQPFTPEATGLQNYCTASRAQIPEAIALIQKLVGTHAAAVMVGTAPATLKRLAAPYVAPVAPPAPPTVQMLSTRPVKWNDHDGKQVVAQAFTEITLTPSAAKRALALKACVPMNDPLAKRKGIIAGHGRAEHALDLDVDPDQPLRSAPQFEVIIGEPRKASIV